MQRIVIQGVEGSYSHAAALWYFGERITVVSSATFAGAFNAVAEGLVDAAMVPIGNSYAGPVREVCHLLKDSNLVVTGACQRLIRHCLMALPGQTLEHITRVRSHPQALMQCDVFLSRLGVEIVEAPDTAGSAKLIREQALYGVAAIASAHAARIYQLDILAEDIQVREDNTTCFVVLRKAEARLACLDAKKRGGCAMPANRPQVDLPAQRAAHAGARIQKGRVLFPGASTVHLDPGTTPGAPLERTSSPLAGFAPGCGRCGPGLASQAAFRRAEVSDRTPHGDPAAQIPGGKDQVEPCTHLP